MKSCQQNTASNAKFQNIEMSELTNRMTKESVLIDVRTPEEYSEGSIPGAININVKSDDFQKLITKMNKESDYLIFCRSGRRSVTASEIMSDSGFKKLTNIKGGYLAYKEMNGIK